MTAEIAILNRSALALAADSAVTISVGTKTKVYDTAEKLFELSRSQPLALMIYNNVEFVGVPLDVLIRKFRCEKADITCYSSMAEVSSGFLAYIEGFDHHVNEEKPFLPAVVRDEFKKIGELHTRRLRRELSAFAKDPNNIVLPKPTDILQKLLEKALERKRARPLDGYLTRIGIRQFKARFSDVMDLVYNDIFKTVEINDTVQAIIYQLGLAIIKSRDGSDLLTGLVFGGFAEKDMFPTLRYLEIDGVFFNKVKVLSTSEVDIDREHTRAEVVPFAQKEMVERFMFGLDTELEVDLERFVKSAVDEVIDAVGQEADEDVKNSIRAKVRNKFSAMSSKLKDSSRQDLLDIVYFMSKKELADIAHALVELTSHKRRFSTDEQTVGGAIDVAILTKSEGLVWIRRKHYFSLEENQAYFARIQSNFGGGDGSQKATV